jgi:hypothetical protein
MIASRGHMNSTAGGAAVRFELAQVFDGGYRYL